MFVPSFKNGNGNPTRDSFNKYCMPLVEIKDFNAWTDNKPFLDEPVKSKQEAHGKRKEISRNDNYGTGNFLDFTYHQNYYKRIGIDILRQTNMNIPQQINFTRKLEEDDGATMFFIAEKQQKAMTNFSLDSLIVTE